MSAGPVPPVPPRQPLLPIVLASASPRRRDLLTAAGLRFELQPADVDESLPEDIAPDAAAWMLAERKALFIAGLREHEHAPVHVIGADTIVAVDGPTGPRLLGKPADRAEAAEMLAALSGTTHSVWTGVSVVRTGALAPGAPRARTGVERTLVTMRALTPAEIRGYVDLGEWEGKAGGYAIQESADAFVTGLEEGGFDNVVGLPVALTLELLARSASDGPANKGPANKGPANEGPANEGPTG